MGDAPLTAFVCYVRGAWVDVERRHWPSVTNELRRLATRPLLRHRHERRQSVDNVNSHLAYVRLVIGADPNKANARSETASTPSSAGSCTCTA